jgi:hypothetical protein
LNTDLANHVKQGGDVRDVLRMYRGKNIPALYRERERMAIAKGGMRASTFPSTLENLLGPNASEHDGSNLVSDFS